MKQITRKTSAGRLALISIILLFIPAGIYAQQSNTAENLCNKVYRDIVYDTGSTVGNLDIYMPARYAASKSGNSNRSTPYPAIIAIGSTSEGKPENIPGAMQALEYGYAVVVPEYGNGISEQISDIIKVLEWIKANGQQYGLDRDKIVLWGASYGGYLAAVAGCAGTYLQGFESEMDFYNSDAMARAQKNEQENQKAANGFGIYTANNSAKVQAVVDLYGLLSISGSNISPQRFITPQSPPFFMMYGEKDTVVSYKSAGNFASELKNAIGTAYVEYILLPDAGHGGTIFEDQQLIRQIFVFLERILFR